MTRRKCLSLCEKAGRKKRKETQSHLTSTSLRSVISKRALRSNTPSVLAAQSLWGLNLEVVSVKWLWNKHSWGQSLTTKDLREQGDSEMAPLIEEMKTGYSNSNQDLHLHNEACLILKRSLWKPLDCWLTSRFGFLYIATFWSKRMIQKTPFMEA